jgi:hypothetical protein
MTRCQGMPTHPSVDNHGCVGCEQDARPMTNHQAETIRAVILFAIAAMLIACTGCTEQPNEYGSNTDTERGVCASEGQPATAASATAVTSRVAVYLSKVFHARTPAISRDLKMPSTNRRRSAPPN